MNIALLGYNIENASVYDFLKSTHTEANFTVYDQADSPARDLPEGVDFVGGLDSFMEVEADLVIRSPGVSPHKINPAVKVTTATQLFFENSPTSNIIGVTGSKGKGTTCSLIASIMRAGGHKTHLVGNIGQPALGEINNITPGDVVVYELSSFQLWDLTISPRTAVILMIEPDHLDVHADMNEYVGAKSHITAYQSSDDRLVYQSRNSLTSAIAAASVASKVPVSSPEGVDVRDGYFWYHEQKLCSISHVKLQGSHNLDNAAAAIAACWSLVSEPAILGAGLEAFAGLDHRLKQVGAVGDVDYYDDSIATTPGSAIASIKSFDQPKILIVGGSDKGADYQPLAEVIADTKSVKLVITIGANGNAIADVLAQAGLDERVSRQSDLSSMDSIVELASQSADAGDVVILSPAAASFDMFKSYKDRGDQFIAAVNNLER
ncbi:MAG: UDP-N-acetylmuramoyl-L-alanine--D-glutamate ligase [bacterium]|nr:UDP-N-acetylmuramoyl-L-alanine--D-glutamate ligase [bacterium]